jgi:CheY-like chemotaxis protein
MSGREKEPILLIEDNADDAELIKMALTRAGIGSPVEWLDNGEAALAYLEGTGAFENREEYPIPSLILLDLKLARSSGFSVLKWQKQHPDLKKVPTIVLTSSMDPADIDKAYALGAESYLVKPKDFDGLVELLRVKATYWRWR